MELSEGPEFSLVLPQHQFILVKGSWGGGGGIGEGWGLNLTNPEIVSPCGYHDVASLNFAFSKYQFELGVFYTVQQKLLLFFREILQYAVGIYSAEL
jgi:hypothetical protein